MFPEHHPGMDPQHLPVECFTLLPSLPEAQQTRVHRAVRAEPVQNGESSLQCPVGHVEFICISSASKEVLQ